MTTNNKEKDACGVGFIASRGLPATHGMTLKILECLANLDHRGAKFSDGTGDGAGVLTELPFELLEAELQERKIDYDQKANLGVVSCFFDKQSVASFLTVSKAFERALMLLKY